MGICGMGQRFYGDTFNLFFEFDNKNPVKMAPKLTHKHIYLPAFTAMRVKYATQVLSHTMASGISTLSVLGQLPSAASETAKFIDKFDKLFNAFNSVSLSSPQQYRHAITASLSSARCTSFSRG